MENQNSIQKEIELYLEKENLDKDKIRNFFEDKLAKISQPRMRDFRKLMAYYSCAMMEVETKLNVLDTEFGLQHDRNPIIDIKTRLKSFSSIRQKMERQKLNFDFATLEENINDVAGVRVVCSFPDDVYMLADALLKQDDIKLVTMKDYIKNPKPNGYRSLHLIVTVPIFLAKEKKLMKVEIQLRTIAMDLWASLEHQLHYKKDFKFTKEMSDELLLCANLSAELDKRMDDLRLLALPNQEE